jgi:PTS system nitrogen regulatory IIA component
MELSIREVSEMLQVSEKTIQRWLTEGTIPHQKVNNQFRFNRAELLEWATAKKIPFSPTLYIEPESAAKSLPQLSDALEAGGIFYKIPGADKEAVLKAISGILRLPNGADREMLFRMLMTREALGSTGIGDGIAIPHVRNPIVLNLARPAVSLCFLEKPINILFTILSSNVRVHLHLLSRLSYVLHDQKFREALAKQAFSQQIVVELRRVEKTLRPPDTSPNP